MVTNQASARYKTDLRQWLAPYRPGWLARSLGKSSSQMTSWVQGTALPSSPIFIALQRLLPTPAPSSLLEYYSQPQPSPPTHFLAERARRLFQAYRQSGSLGTVAQQCGLSRERVRQILRTATVRGLLPEGGYTAAIGKQQRLRLLIQAAGGAPHIRACITALHGSVAGVCRQTGLSRKVLHKLFASELAAARAAHGDLVGAYRRHEAQLGYPPTSTWIFRHDHALYARVARTMSWSAFFRQHHITPHYTSFRRGTRRKQTKAQIWARYQTLAQTLGFLPNSVDCQEHDAGLMGAIWLRFGGFGAFRRHYHLTGEHFKAPRRLHKTQEGG